eukprot:snap_masked-scaffold_5-processed-gene-20.57-mRNA-1 protein AED:1.00 eAED:1.00 QI:0/0/0/0/1/1/2/0/64
METLKKILNNKSSSLTSDKNTFLLVLCHFIEDDKVFESILWQKHTWSCKIHPKVVLLEQYSEYT